MLGDCSTPGRTDLAAPTARLPSIKFIQTIPLPELRSSVDYLRVLYNPEIRGSRRRKALGSKPKDRGGDGRLQAIRADSFERSHAIRWLTALIVRGDALFTSASDLEDNGNEENARDSLIEDAASLLAACAGTAASGRLIRTYVLGPSPMGEEVVLRLTDAPLENGDYASVGAQTWGGACVMADMVFEDPEQFELPLHRNTLESAERTFHVLELGAGTGLVGLAIAKLLELRNIRANVVLTDVHPSVLANLRSNTTANFESTTTSCVDVSVVSLNWFSFASAATSGNNALGTFDLIVGADIVYETGHAMWIKACLEKLLRTDAHFHLVIPLRRTHTTESSTIEQVFGQEPSNTRLVIVHREHFSCDAHSDANSRMWDRADEVEYVYYKIGWKLTEIALP